MAANVSSPSVYSLHTHTEGWGELHFILQGWKVLPGEPSAWGGWGSCSAVRDWEENCSLHLQGLLGEEIHTWTHFLSFAHYLSLSCSLPFLCLHAPSSPYHDELPSTFVTPLVWEMLSVLQHHAPCKAQRSRTNSPINTSSCRGCFSVVNLSHAQQVCDQPCHCLLRRRGLALLSSLAGALPFFSYACSHSFPLHLPRCRLVSPLLSL